MMPPTPAPEQNREKTSDTAPSKIAETAGEKPPVPQPCEVVSLDSFRKK